MAVARLCSVFWWRLPKPKRVAERPASTNQTNDSQGKSCRTVLQGESDFVGFLEFIAVKNAEKFNMRA